MMSASSFLFKKKKQPKSDRNPNKAKSPDLHQVNGFFYWLAFLITVLSLWQTAAWVMHNSLICPSPAQTFSQMIEQARAPGFFIAIAWTIGRALGALAASFVLAIPASFAGAFYGPAREFLNRLVSILQTVPNVCYIILLLFWTDRNATVILTGVFLLFPLIYRSLYEQLAELIHQYRPIWIVYNQPRIVLMLRVCFPMLRPAFLAALKNASSLGFKACVTSEILTGIAPGMGKKIQAARLDLNLAGVFAWSIWLILLVFAFEKLWNLCIDHLFVEK
ncbi:ABC transporter permease [Allobaculum sp. JKK-2023]|uniref:ABC transporter permease n=1 Tax=Allobaculum sp. JKK-2023 TaxID=3108943 RepID=UPI002B05481A|nr:ABC transporter permease subunit [Allobaculum sp. JKK-2023]